MHLLSVDHFQSSKLGMIAVSNPPYFDDYKWSTDIRNEVTS